MVWPTVTLLACGGAGDPAAASTATSDTSGGASAGATGTSTGGTTATPTSGAATASDETTGDGTTSADETTGDGTTGDETSGTSTGETSDGEGTGWTGGDWDDCDRPDEPSECFAFVGECLAGDEGCPPEPWGPALTCDGPMLCPTVDVSLCARIPIEPQLDDAAAAQCFLAALRDRAQGFLRMEWGDPHGYGTDGSSFYAIDVFSRGDGTVLIVASWSTILADGLAIEIHASPAIPLREPAYFAACAAAQDEQALIGCLVDVEAKSLSTLPWLLPTCSAFESC